MTDTQLLKKFLYSAQAEKCDRVCLAPFIYGPLVYPLGGMGIGIGTGTGIGTSKY